MNSSVGRSETGKPRTIDGIQNVKLGLKLEESAWHDLLRCIILWCPFENLSGGLELHVFWWLLEYGSTGALSPNYFVPRQTRAARPR